MVKHLEKHWSMHAHIQPQTHSVCLRIQSTRASHTNTHTCMCEQYMQADSVAIVKACGI